MYYLLLHIRFILPSLFSPSWQHIEYDRTTFHAKWFTHPRSSLVAKFGAYSMCTQSLSCGSEDRLRYRPELSEVCIPVRAKIFVLSRTFRQSLGPIQPPCQWAPGQYGLEAGHSPLSKSEAKNEWSYISTPPIRRHDADKERLYIFTQPFKGFFILKGSYNNFLTAVHCM